jgi:hypothetical protein
LKLVTTTTLGVSRVAHEIGVTHDDRSASTARDPA